MAEPEGVVQYHLDHEPGPLPPVADLGDLVAWFGTCRRAGLIGRDPARYDGCAFGNISLRAPVGFVISGTQTGGRDHLRESDLSWVRAIDIGRNRVSAGGPHPPSSESLTHGQIYQAEPSITAVIHAHSPEIWRHAADLGLPVTAANAGYGTPAMARAVADLLAAMPATAAAVFAMGGHEDGIIAFGTTMTAAGDCLLQARARAAAG